MTDPKLADLIAELAVRNLVGRYCEAVLGAGPDAFAALWTEDARWVGRGTVTGRAAIREAFALARPSYRLCVQELLSGTVTVEGASAHGRWVVRELQWRTDGTGSQLLGLYDDDVVRDDDGEWRFRRRAWQSIHRGRADLAGRLYPFDAAPSADDP